MNIISLLITLTIAILGFVGIVYVLKWAIAKLELPEPVMTVTMIVVAILFLLVLLGIVTGAIVVPGIRFVG